MRKQKINDKGFTLVELIVVLVILAILAAILVPALLGYIDRARGSQILLNAKSVMTAAQAEASNAYGIAKDKQTAKDLVKPAKVATTADTPAGASFYFNMLGPVEGEEAYATPNNHKSWTVGDVLYEENGQYAFYDAVQGSWDQELTSTDAASKKTSFEFSYEAKADDGEGDGE